MKLTRSGHHRHRGTDEIVSGKDVKIREFNSKNKTVEVNAIDRDPDNQRVTYNYRLALTAQDIGGLIASLDGKLSAEDLQMVAEALRPHTRSLLRLLNLSAGIPMETAPAASR